MLLTKCLTLIDRLDRADESSKSDDSHTVGEKAQSTSSSGDASLTQGVRMLAARGPVGQMLAAQRPSGNNSRGSLRTTTSCGLARGLIWPTCYRCWPKGDVTVGQAAHTPRRRPYLQSRRTPLGYRRLTIPLLPICKRDGCQVYWRYQAGDAGIWHTVAYAPQQVSMTTTTTTGKLADDRSGTSDKTILYAEAQPHQRTSMLTLPPT